MSTRLLTFAAIVTASVSLLIGFIIAELPWVTVIIVFLGAMWAISEVRGWRWPGSLILFLLIILAAIGIVIEVSPIWSITAAASSLAAWEFSNFHRTIRSASKVLKEKVLEKRHNRRVVIITFLGILIAWTTTQITIEFGFGIALLLALVSILGLSRAVVFLRKAS